MLTRCFRMQQRHIDIACRWSTTIKKASCPPCSENSKLWFRERNKKVHRYNFRVLKGAEHVFLLRSARGWNKIERPTPVINNDRSVSGLSWVLYIVSLFLYIRPPSASSLLLENFPWFSFLVQP